MAGTEEKRTDEAREWELRLERLDRNELEGFGRILDQRPARLRGRTVGMALAERLLVVRRRDGKPGLLRANATQRAFERRRGERNIVLKARQMGLTTWAAASEIPPEWYGGDLSEMERLVEKLLARRSLIRELIEGFGRSDRKPFPKWGGMGKSGEQGWKGTRWGTSMAERVM